MRTNTRQALLALVLVTNFLTAAPIYALTKTRPLTHDTYEKTSIEFVTAFETMSEVRCDNNDEAVKGSCDVTNVRAFPEPVTRGVRVNQDRTATTQNCKVLVLDPRLEARLTSAVVCKKHL